MGEMFKVRVSCGMKWMRKAREEESKKCALLMLLRVWDGRDQGYIVRAIGKVGIVKYARVCVCASMNLRSKKGREEMRKYRNYVNDCLKEIRRRSRRVIIRHMNGRIRKSEVGGVVGRWSEGGGKEKVMERYTSANNTNIWIRDLDMEQTQ